MPQPEQPTQPTEKVFAAGKIFELVHTTQPDGRVFEVARRAPGVRMIIADMQAKKVLLTKEYRSELGAWDYRLPGGKVFDTLAEYEAFRKSGEDIIEAARHKAIAESTEEAGIMVHDLEYVSTSTLGATVEWDLHVFAAINWEKHHDGQQLEQGEQIETDTWFDYDTAKQMILGGDMHEERIALALLRWITLQEGITQ